MRTIPALCLAAALSFGAAIANASTIFDGSGLNNSSTVMDAGSAIGGVFTFTEVVTITSISQLIKPEDSGNVKFFIIESFDFEQFDLVYEGASQAFISTEDFISFTSTPLSYSIQTDAVYVIGAIMNVSGAYTFNSGNEIQGTVTLNGAVMVNNFNSPTSGDFGIAAPAVSLHSGGSTIAPIPLPASAPLLIAALGAIGFLRSRRKAAV